MGLLLTILAAGVAGSFTDWLFMGVLAHKQYFVHPEVWREGRTDVRKIVISTLIGAVGSAAFAYLLLRAGAHGLGPDLAWAVLVWAAGPLPLLITNGQWIKIHPYVTAAHCGGWLARFAVTAVIASVLMPGPVV